MKKLCSGFLSFVLCLNTMGVLQIHAEGEGTPEPIPDEVFETVTEETAEPESLETVEEVKLSEPEEYEIVVSEESEIPEETVSDEIPHEESTDELILSGTEE